MKTVSFGNMTDYDAEAQQLAERKKYAEALRAQGQQPVPNGQMVGNQFVATHPLQHLASALRQYSGQRDLQDVRTAEQGLAQRKQSDLADYLKSMPSATTTTEQQLVGDRPGAGSFEPVSTTKQPTPEDFMNWSMQGLKFGPQVAQLGGNMANQVQQRDFQNRQLEQQTADRQAAIKQAEMQFQTKLQEGRLTREQAAQQAMQLEQMRIDGRREIAQLAASLKQGGSGAQPYFTPVPTSGGIGSFDNRTGNMKIISGSDGKPVIKSSDDPTLQGAIAGAKDRAQAEVKRDMNMSGVGDIINSARALLQDEDNPPTQSFFGNVADMAAGTVGVTPDGAEQADKLRAIGGALVSKMPRMEGPQSNYDVQNYKEMAGDVGNPNLPIKRRLAALKTVEEIVTRNQNKSANPAIDDILKKY